MIIFHLLWITIVVTVCLLAVALVLHALPHFNLGGRELAEWLCRAPGLDLVVGFFVMWPLLYGLISTGIAGMIFAIAGQVLAILIWAMLHELWHHEAASGPRIMTVLNGLVGKWQNYAALWVTSISAPLFVFVRLAELTLYPLLSMLVGLPTYPMGDWVNVSRQKFSGLVGHDLIWCLYCDWMTGVVSLQMEMLRNIESFWCPIRFSNTKKCANCSVEFPDIYAGWVDAGGTMADVAKKLQEMYGSGERSWFSSPVRLTVHGEEASEPEHTAADTATPGVSAPDSGPIDMSAPNTNESGDSENPSGTP